MQTPTIPKAKENDSDTLRFRGTVIKTGVDRNGNYYGFITRQPHDVFFHEKDNAGLSFDGLTGQEVLYNIITDSKSGNEKAVAIVSIR